MKCPLCASTLTESACPTCHLPFETTADGPKLSADYWHLANDSQWANNPMSLRDPLTRRVRELAHDHITGQHRLPDDCANRVFALLLDLHCNLEGRIVSMRDRIRQLENLERRPRFVPPRLPHPRRAMR